MRKAFNKKDTELLEIKPVEEIVDEVIPDGVDKIEKIKYKHEEVFEESKTNEEVSVVNEDVDGEKITEIEEKPKKKRGQRGKDKKPRVKKPATEKQLAHLARIREVSRLKREATKKEKAKKEVVPERKVKSEPIPIPQKTPQAPSMNMEQFIEMYEKIEEIREKRNKPTKKAEPTPEPERPVHNPLKNSPVAETNPYAMCFNYK